MLQDFRHGRCDVGNLNVHELRSLETHQTASTAVSCLSGSKASGEQKAASRGAPGKLGNISTASKRPCAQAKTGADVPAVYMLLPAAHLMTFPSLLHHAGCK